MTDLTRKAAHVKDHLSSLFEPPPGGGMEIIMNSTIRLFDLDSHQTEFTAAVVCCMPVPEAQNKQTKDRDAVPFSEGESQFPKYGISAADIPQFPKTEKNHYLVVLDRTLFFPEGGGQAADTGVLVFSPAASAQMPAPSPSDTETKEPSMEDPETPALPSSADLRDTVIHVLDVREKNGVIFHLTDRPVPVQSTVDGRIDWEKRFDRMQQHSGEHIFSGLVHSLFGYDNVGFHLGEEETTLDFSGPLTDEQISEVELEVNHAVAADLPILVHYPSRSELSSWSYRSKIEIEGQVRLVEIPGYDVCACCAPHVSHTGEIGLVKAVRWMNHRGGVRITILCGMRALADYCAKDRSVKEISVLLSSKETRISSAVRHLQEEIYALRGRIMQLTTERLDRELAALPAKEQDPLFILEELPSDQVREFVNQLTARCSGVCCVFYGSDEKGYSYILGSRSTDLRPLCKEMNAALNGRGGGRPEMVQGSVKADADSIRAWARTCQ